MTGLARGKPGSGMRVVSRRKPSLSSLPWVRTLLRIVNLANTFRNEHQIASFSAFEATTSCVHPVIGDAKLRIFFRGGAGVGGGVRKRS